MNNHVEIYDTTLRDGAQGEGVNFSVGDKCRIAEHLDALGVDFVEGGWPGSNPRDVEFFERKVRPVLVERCSSCHSESKRRGGLSLASRAALLKGGDSGPVVLPGQPEKSLLIKAITGQRFQIGNNKGFINGWVGPNAIFGRLVRVEV